ncbi:MAG: LLM class flavin-dependent oxidoreductase [Candidatus Methylomirabilia bacterium]
MALQALRECVEIVQRLWTGERFTYHGSCFRVTDAALEFRPSGDELPIYLGAKSQRGLILAGEIAEGALLSPLTSPGHVVRARADVARGHRQAGRKDRVMIAAYVVVSVDPDGGLARDRVREVVAQHLGILHGQSILSGRKSKYDP